MSTRRLSPRAAGPARRSGGRRGRRFRRRPDGCAGSGGRERRRCPPGTHLRERPGRPGRRRGSMTPSAAGPGGGSGDDSPRPAPPWWGADRGGGVRAAEARASPAASSRRPTGQPPRSRLRTPPSRATREKAGARRRQDLRPLGAPVRQAQARRPRATRAVRAQDTYWAASWAPSEVRPRKPMRSRSSCRAATCCRLMDTGRMAGERSAMVRPKGKSSR